MTGSHDRKIVLIVALVASLVSLPVCAQDPTDEATAKIIEKFGGNIKLSCPAFVWAEVNLVSRTVMEYLLSPVRKVTREVGRQR
jgi:hypothetical protein